MIVEFPKMKPLGFVIANDQEEYLYACKSTRVGSACGWVPLPGLAKRYSNRAKAARDATKLPTMRRTWVLELSETATQYVVSAEGEDRPPWI